MRMTKTCLVCGNIFSKKPTESKKYWEKKKYCGVACALVNTSVSLQENPNRGKPLSAEVKKKISDSLKGRAPNSGSFKKGIVSWAKGKKFPNLSGENSPKWKQKIQASCAYCKKVLLLPPWRTKVKRFFCDRTCWALGTRGHGSPVFKGEESKKNLRDRVMQLPEYVAWRKSVFSRDGYACTQCSAKGYLEADHIVSFAKIVKENRISTPIQARNCAPLWDISNGRTLCRECHRKTDTYLKRLKK